MWLISFALAGPHATQEAQYHQEITWNLPVLPRVPLPPAAVSSKQAHVYGYHPYWGDDPTKLDYRRLTDVAIFEVGLNSDGTLSYTSRWTGVAGSVVPLAHAQGCKVHLCVVSFDSGTQSSVLPSASKRATAIAALKALVDQYGADGVNVDIEGLSSSLREDLVTFTTELDAAVDEVWVATPAVDWSNAFDKVALSKLSGGMFIMGYDYHWPGGDPGPNAPLYGGGPWSSYSLEKTVKTYLSDGADPKKIVLGLPLYGQEWPVSSQTIPASATGDGWSVLMDEAEGIGAAEGGQYDSTSHTPYVKRSGTQLWYDDNNSVQERIHFAIGQGLGGIGFWALTYEGNDPAFWDMVETETKLPGDDTGTDTGSDTGTDTGKDTGEKPSEDLPMARAGEQIDAQVGDIVYLNGSGSSDPNGYPLRYTWSQSTGPEQVKLVDADEAEPHFTIPASGTYTFQLLVESRTGSSPADTVQVVAEEAGGCSTAPSAASGGMVGLGLLLLRRRRR